MSKKTDPKNFPVVIFVEGISDKEFIRHFIEDELFDKNQKTFYIQMVDGIENLRKKVTDFIPTVDTEAKTKDVLLICDADNDYNSNKQKLDDIISKVTETDISFHTYIFPFNDNSTPGSLETLCLSILSEENKEKYLEISKNAINQSDKVKDVHKEKNLLSCYFSLFDEYCEGLLGTNAGIGAFNFNSPELEPLKEILQKLSNENDKTPVTV
jgi:predicted ATP-dependent endonuclease of OLD family